MAWDKPSGDQKPNDSWGGGSADFSGAFQSLKKILDNFGQGGGSGWRTTLGLTVVAALVWGLFGIYQLDQQERAVILRFGKFHNVVQPGLRWNPPLIDRVHKINVTKVYSQPYNGQMLTEDENIVDIKITVQYRVSDPKQFVLRVRDPIRSLQHAIESALRHVVGGTIIDQVITLGREQVAIDVRGRLQTYLDVYETGISVFQVNINEADPPQDVKGAFDDVNRALEDEERYKNEAEAYANEVVPRARGYAKRALEEAEAYRQEVIARAEGEATRFQKLLDEYRKAPLVTRKRLYLDAVQSVLGKTSKVMVDVEEGGNLLYLPLDQLRRGSSAGDMDGEVLNPSQMRDLVQEVSQRLERARGTQRKRATR